MIQRCRFCGTCRPGRGGRDGMTDTSIAESRLVAGPQDGARVRIGGGFLPHTVYVGPKWLGDGFAAWSRHPSRRFPARYDYRDGKFRFKQW